MKKLKLSTVAILCAFLGGVGGGIQSGCGTSTLQDLWHNPAVQAEVASAEQLAIQLAQEWLAQHRGVSARSAATGPDQSGVQEVESKVHAKYPNLPPNIVHDIVVTKFAEQ